MIKTHSDDPDVAQAAAEALDIITHTLQHLPKATGFDYGGHDLQLGEYGVCVTCGSAIAEAQQAYTALQDTASALDDPLLKEHIELAARLLKLDAEAAVIRAELHNGQGSEGILNAVLGFEYDRAVHDDYQHSHHQGA